MSVLGLHQHSLVQFQIAANTVNLVWIVRTGANEVNVNSLDSQPAAGKAGKAGGWKRQDIYTPQPLLSAVCRKAPQFKVSIVMQPCMLLL